MPEVVGGTAFGLMSSRALLCHYPKARAAPRMPLSTVLTTEYFFIRLGILPLRSRQPQRADIAQANPNVSGRALPMR